MIPLLVTIIFLGLLLIAAISQRRDPQVEVITPTLTPSPTPTPNLRVTATPTPTTRVTPTPTLKPTLRPAQINITFPTPNQIVTSPLNITGRAQGFWFFEATAPIRLVDTNGQVLATSFITAQGEWMTENFVPFTGQLQFSSPTTATGQLILERSNPSGLPQNDQQVAIPVRFR